MDQLHVELRPAYRVMGDDLEVGVEVDGVGLVDLEARAWPDVELVLALTRD